MMRQSKVQLAWGVLLICTAAAVPAQRGDCGGAEPSGWSGRLAPEDEPGERLVVTGRVVDEDSGRALAGVRILAYQTDASGLYSRHGENEAEARLCAVVRTDSEGRYRLDTVLPGRYPTGRVPRHIHFVVGGDTIPKQRLELRFADDPLTADQGLAEAPTWNRIRPVTREEDGVLRVTRDLRVRPGSTSDATGVGPIGSQPATRT